MENYSFPRQTFKTLFSFQSGKVKYLCSKAEDDEVYRVRELVTCDATSACWTFRRDVYMTVEKYNLFVSENKDAIEISKTKTF